ncbi:MAG: 30S ribosomal protein S2, partial [Acidobacteriota bacterium]
FVGTMRQALDAIKEEAARCNQFYINQRWLGGLLTNFQTIQKSIKRYKDIEAMQADGRIEQYAKKERLEIERERLALEKNFSGIKEMRRLPDAIFIIDTNKEEIAVKEANKLDIPVVAIVDTNCSPEGVTYVIPGNDDALRAVRLFASRIADAILEGHQLAEQKEAEDAATAAEQAKISGVTVDIQQRQQKDRGDRGERGGRGRDRGERGGRGGGGGRSGDSRGGDRVPRLAAAAAAASASAAPAAAATEAPIAEPAAVEAPVIVEAPIVQAPEISLAESA